MIKQLKICVAVLAGVLACGSLKAQQADSPDTAKPYEVYCEIVSTGGGFFTNKMTVEVDFGQFSSFFSNDRQLVDEQGNPIVFNSILDAANYMAERGWVFKQAYVLTTLSDGNSGTRVHHWIMAKTITDKSQITEGLRTARMR